MAPLHIPGSLSTCWPLLRHLPYWTLAQSRRHLHSPSRRRRRLPQLRCCWEPTQRSTRRRDCSRRSFPPSSCAPRSASPPQGALSSHTRPPAQRGAWEAAWRAPPLHWPTTTCTQWARRRRPHLRRRPRHPRRRRQQPCRRHRLRSCSTRVATPRGPARATRSAQAPAVSSRGSPAASRRARQSASASRSASSSLTSRRPGSAWAEAPL